jgi:hypothetical protein
MNNPKEKGRTQDFKWHSKQELYGYFDETFGLQKQHVDREILMVRANFKERKNQTINTAELWQKVGLNLERKFGGGL